jgi:hypothetical protein
MHVAHTKYTCILGAPSHASSALSEYVHIEDAMCVCVCVC